MKHKVWAFFYIVRFCLRLMARAIRHDISKFSAIETRGFALNMDRIRGHYYTASKPTNKKKHDALIAALHHHYSANRHHPEFYDKGISGMNLADVTFMFFDWLAATRGSQNGHILNSIEENRKRFQMSDDLTSIFINEAGVNSDE